MNINFFLIKVSISFVPSVNFCHYVSYISLHGNTILEFLSEYGLFLAKTVTFVAAVIALLITVIAC